MSLDIAFVVRRGEEADLPAILALLASSEEAPRWTEAVWQRFLAVGDGDDVNRLVLLAQAAGGELMGLLAGTSFLGQIELEAVLVRREGRRRGIGRALVQAWMTWAEGERGSVASLEVRASNAAAVALYASLGFAVHGRRRRYYREPTEDALLMGRQIRGL